MNAWQPDAELLCFGPKGQQFDSSLRRMAGPLGLKRFLLFEDLVRWTRLLERMTRWAEEQ